MFLVKDSPDERERRIRQFLAGEPSIAAVLAAIHLEWTIKRAILKLSSRSTALLRSELIQAYGLDGYKEAWRRELGSGGLPALIGAPLWERVKNAFALRNQIVHGAGGCTRRFAEPRVAALLSAAEIIRQFAEDRGSNLYSRLQARNRKTAGPSSTKKGGK